MGLKKGDMETNFEIRSYDSELTFDEYDQLPKHPIYIVLDNLRSAFNVGSIFRLCDTMRVSGLFLCGYTAYPPHLKLEKTSLGTIGYVPWKHFEQTEDAIAYLRERNVAVFAAETTSHSVKYHQIRYPKPVAVVFGNEALGVGPDILQSCDSLIEIPTYGYKNSLNVATSVAVIGYRIVEQMVDGQ